MISAQVGRKEIERGEEHKKLASLLLSFSDRLLVLLLQGHLAFLKNCCNFALHKGPWNVGAGQGTPVPARTEHFLVSSLLLDGVSAAWEAKFVIADSGTLQ